MLRTDGERAGRMPEERRLFLQLCVSILVSIANGSIFCFGIFSPFMKSGKFGFDQEQVNIVSTTGAVLSYFSLPTGFLFDRFGPRPTLIAGVVTNVIGWLGMYVIFVNEEAPLLGTSTAVVSFFFGISQLSASFYETGSVLTNLEALSQHQGRVVLIQKTFMGLGSSVVAQIYVGFFETHYQISSFFLFLAVFNATMGVWGAYAIRLPTHHTRIVGLNCPFGAMGKHRPSDIEAVNGNNESEENGDSSSSACDPMSPSAEDLVAKKRYDRPFAYGTAVLLVVVAYVTAATIVEDYVTLENGARYGVGIVTIVLIAAFFGMVVLVPVARSAAASASAASSVRGFARTLQKRTPAGDIVEYGGVEQAEPAQPATGLSHESRNDNDADARQPPLDVAAAPHDHRDARSTRHRDGSVRHFLNSDSLWSNVFRVEMLLMWFVSFAVWGAATVVSGNSSQIYQALDYDGYNLGMNTVYVSIYGVASAVGRILVGSAHPMLLTRRIHVSILFSAAPIINVIGLPLFFVLPGNGLIVAFFFIGLATGVTWGGTVLIIKALFIPSSCGKHYNVLYTAGMLTPLIMNVGIFGPNYDHYSKQQGLWDSHTCDGKECVLLPMVVSLALNVAAVFAAMTFSWRIRKNGGI